MSLVNDMLRDLDNRRSESESPRGRLALTPANEYPDLEKSRTPYYVAAGLILVVAALAYLWLQLDRGGEPRSLNISSEVASGSANTPVSSTGSETETSAAELVQNQIEATAAAELQLEEVVQLTQEAIVSEIISTNQGIDLQELAQAIAEINNTEPAAVVIDTPRTAPEPAVTNAVAEASTIIATAPTRTEIVSLTQSAVVDIGGSTESIKDASDLSPQQQDVMKVQEALRIMASNRVEDAYAVLGEYITVNRYAHQSRETYAKLLLSEGAVRQAANLVEAGLQLAPNHSGFKKIKARLLVASGEINTAVDLLLRRAPDVSEDLEYHEILATAQLVNRDYEGSAVSYNSLLKEDRNQGKWWYGFAASQDFLGNTGAARAAYTEAVRQSNLSANLRLRSEERLASLAR